MTKYFKIHLGKRRIEKKIWRLIDLGRIWIKESKYNIYLSETENSSIKKGIMLANKPVRFTKSSKKALRIT